MKIINQFKQKHPKVWEILKFLLIGGSATVIDFLLMSIFIYAFKAESFGYNFFNVFFNSKNVSETWLIVCATGIGFIGGLIFNYIFSIVFVFEETKFAKTKKGFFLFSALALAGLSIHLLGMYLGYDLLKINEWIVKIFLTILVLIFNYITRKKLIFNAKGE